MNQPDPPPSSQAMVTPDYGHAVQMATLRVEMDQVKEQVKRLADDMKATQQFETQARLLWKVGVVIAGLLGAFISWALTYFKH